MPELTQEELYFRTKRRLLIFKILGVVAVAVIVVLFWQGCEGEKNRSIAYAAIEDSLRKQIAINQDVAFYADHLANVIDSLGMKAANADYKRRIAENALLDQGKKMNRLAVAYEKAKVEKDTVKMLANCDSIVEENKMLQAQAQEVIETNRVAGEFYTESLEYLDSLARHWETAYKGCMKTIEFVAGELPKIKPKGKMYVDVSAMTGAVTAGGIGIGYMDKNGRIVNADLLISRHGNIYQLRAATPLSLKRKK